MAAPKNHGVLNAPVSGWCHWPFRSMVLSSDGSVVCGCADPFVQRPLGNAAQQSLLEIWNGEGFQQIRRGVNAGDLAACGDCGLRELRPDPAPPTLPLQLDRGPTRLFVEPSIVCNISCYKAVCNQENGIVGSRTSKLLPFWLFKKTMDELGPGLERLEFYNYGESFVNPNCYDMIAYAKERFPGLFIYASSNGLLFYNQSRREKLLKSGLDEIVFSIDGASAESYSRYRVKGDFELVTKNLRECVRLKRILGLQRPRIIWRYILFRWNDSHEEMTRALELAKKIGVDGFYWEITDHPPGTASERFVPGTESFQRIRHQVWGYSHLGARADLRLLEAPVEVMAGGRFQLLLDAKNLGHDLWEPNHPLHKEFVRIGVQLLDEHGLLLNRDWSRHWLPHAVRPGESVRLNLELTAPLDPGDYILRIDGVLEGVTWFQDVGSQVLEAEFRVIGQSPISGV